MVNKFLTEEPILEKINKLRAKLLGADTSDQVMLDSWEQEVKKAMITNSLQKHEGVQMIIQDAINDIKDINDVLSNSKSKDLSNSERDSLIDVKNFYKKFINLFDTSQSTLDNMDKQIDEQLAAL